MQYSHEPEAVQPSRNYTRSLPQKANGNTDPTKSTRDRGNRPPSQKAMLSRALQKANAAVQLDNANNIDGAREAYTEACALLHQVLQKTPGEEDKRKLEAIRVTYTARIEELDQLASTQQQDTRPLPRRPPSSGARGRDSSEGFSEEDDDAASRAADDDEGRNGNQGNASNGYVEAANDARMYSEDRPPATEPRSIPSYSVPLLSSSPRLLQSAFSATPPEQPRHVSSLLSDQYTLQSSFSRSPRREFMSLQSANSSSTTHQPPNINTNNGSSTLYPPTQYMPPPLSPRRIESPAQFEDPTTSYGFEEQASGRYSSANLRPSSAGGSRGHTRTASHESVSWLDPINESGSSAASSVHSRSSSTGIRRKHIRATSGATEAEFDAALDDAIEAAYDDGYEPMSSDPFKSQRYNGQEYRGYMADEAQMSQTLRKVELAKERVRETEREAIAFERQLRLRQQQLQEQEEEEEDLVDPDMTRNFLDAGNDSEEEERILEEMTNGLAIEEFAFGLGPDQSPNLNLSLNQKLDLKTPPAPRESDSSEFTSRTWHSSLASNPPQTANTMLSTVTETPPSVVSKAPTGMMPPPTQALPQLPRPSTAQSQNQSQSPNRSGGVQSQQSVRNRRLSGQNMKQLKIETPNSTPSTLPALSSVSSVSASTSQPRTGFLVQQRQAMSAGPIPSRPGSSAATTAGPFPRQFQAPTPSPSIGAGGTMFLGPSPIEAMPPPNFPPPTPPIPQADNDSTAGRSGSPSMSSSANRPGAGVLRKNFSSSSLRSMRSRNMSLTNLDGGGSDISPGTPLSNQFMLGPLLSSSRMPDVPTLPTPLVASFKDRMITTASGVGGMHLLESDFHSPSTPGSPNPMHSDSPIPLEPCPTDTMLRPFWLMRCLYQTLVHPRGGYLSNKLFVPSDVWKVRGVRLKNIDEKISNCDFLTSALLKLAQVDTCDADALLEEMQSLEAILEQVQTVLTRRLGNEVGVQSTHSLFKDASTPVDNDAGAGGPGAAGGSGAVPRTGSVSAGTSSSSRSFSWRRLRSKNSSAGLSSSYNSAGGRKESISDGIGSKDGVTIPSLPMTAQPTRRPAKRDIASAQFTGPNATYMSSLARLFDAAQSIDQVARQVEDPWLRHADKTQVGLELCTRHAAEFFALFICRFVLSDVSLLLEKFIKRGSEWVLA